MKYIVFSVVVEESGLDLEIPILFPSMLVHSMMGKWFQLALDRHWEDAEVNPVSAGSVTFASSPARDRVTCGGDSETMKLKSRPEHDAMLISGMDYSNGVVDVIQSTAHILRRVFKENG